MKLWILSDLHLSRKELGARDLALDLSPEADLAVVAGDICEGIEDAIAWLAEAIAYRMPVIFVAGNHEFYGEYIEQARRVAKSQADRVRNVHFLDDEEVSINGVRFLGCTLWTDYAVSAQGDASRRRATMRAIKSRLSDHVQIWIDPAQTGFVARHFEPRDALALHEKSVAWLSAKLSEPHAGQTVVVTHHAPHPRSIAQHWADDVLTPAFVSDLSHLIEETRPELWIHGHTHVSFDYPVASEDGNFTRLICNPRGYSETENERFDPHLVVEI